MLQNALPAIGLLVLMVFAAWAMQRWRKHLPGLPLQAGPALKVLNSVSLGPQQRVVTLQVGQGADAHCLGLGAAPGGINALHSLPLPTDLPQPSSETATGFAARLAQFKAPKAQGPHAPQ